ncbi:hypothetical protein HELRODRAFT_154433 [Helobdella robusta]|uniref:Pre-rRNA-processing protein TSR2 homolog n=1 Tax=Helobdella robusta TaxID=6412 RepID=T1ELE8_HELRO|nr:hypothetical protein HELRODRAFT_154433 [Helobdella robusta]ESO10782.1 hypothetical protein HELRODRAFT_154433 [Helobdella robusta]
MLSFQSCVASIVDCWSSFNISLSNGCAGSHAAAKKAWLPGAVIQWLMENNCSDAYELEDTLSSILFNEFHLLVEDGTLSLVCSQIIDALTLCESGRASEAVEKYCNKSNRPVANPPVTIQQDDDDDDDDEEVSNGQDEDVVMVIMDTTAPDSSTSAEHHHQPQPEQQQLQQPQHPQSSQQQQPQQPREQRRNLYNQPDQDGWTTVSKQHKKK